jgi:hypothetical protein
MLFTTIFIYKKITRMGLRSLAQLYYGWIHSF